MINGWKIIKGRCGTAERIGWWETVRLQRPRIQNLRIVPHLYIRTMKDRD